MGQARKARWAELRGAAQWSPVQARWVLGELRRSGLSVRDFTAKHEVGSHRIYYWRERLEAGAPPTTQLVEVRVPEASEQRAPASSARIELELVGGRRLSVSEGIDLQRLEALVMVLEGRKC
jgi:hypothetical protein